MFFAPLLFSMKRVGKSQQCLPFKQYQSLCRYFPRKIKEVKLHYTCDITLLERKKLMFCSRGSNSWAFLYISWIYSSTLKVSFLGFRGHLGHVLSKTCGNSNIC